MIIDVNLYFSDVNLDHSDRMTTKSFYGHHFIDLTFTQHSKRKIIFTLSDQSSLYEATTIVYDRVMQQIKNFNREVRVEHFASFTFVGSQIKTLRVSTHDVCFSIVATHVVIVVVLNRLFSAGHPMSTETK